MDSNEFIEEYEHVTSKEAEGQVYLIIKMNEDFARKKISEQYLYLVNFYEEYNEKFSDLLPVYDFLNYMEVYLEETEFPTYIVYYKTFDILAANVNIDRKVVITAISFYHLCHSFYQSLTSNLPPCVKLLTA